MNRAPEFNLNVMGSSAGAGSGEFHLYRLNMIYRVKVVRSSSCCDFLQADEKKGAEQIEATCIQEGKRRVGLRI